MIGNEILYWHWEVFMESNCLSTMSVYVKKDYLVFGTRSTKAFVKKNVMTILVKRQDSFWNKKFEDKTYKKYMIRLRRKDDEALIDFIENKKEEGIGITELVKEGLWKLYNN